MRSHLIGRLRSWSSLRQRADFLKLSQNCQKWVTPAFVVQLSSQADSDSPVHIGFTATKKIGGAVVRNRCKRRLRACCDQVVPGFGLQGRNMVLIARADAQSRDFSLLTKDLRWALRRLGLEAGAKPAVEAPDE